MPETPKILLAEDDLNLGFLLVEFLENGGFEVKLARNGAQALKAFQSGRFAACILDVMMPEMDGFTVANAIRKEDSRIPMLFLTARTLKSDKEKAYGLGADDYLLKPFDEEELLWKLKALIRRSAPPDLPNPSVLQLGLFQFFPENQRLVLGDVDRRLTEKEAKILAYLALHAGQVVRREVLLETFWGENDYFLGRSLDVFISRIRKYLAPDPALKIDTIFGVGFQLNLPQSQSHYAGKGQNP